MASSKQVTLNFQRSLDICTKILAPWSDSFPWHCTSQLKVGATAAARLEHGHPCWEPLVPCPSVPPHHGLLLLWNSPRPFVSLIVFLLSSASSYLNQVFWSGLSKMSPSPGTWWPEPCSWSLDGIVLFLWDLRHSRHIWRKVQTQGSRTAGGPHVWLHLSASSDISWSWAPPNTPAMAHRLFSLPPPDMSFSSLPLSSICTWKPCQSTSFTMTG